MYEAFLQMVQNHHGQWRDDRATPYIVHTATVAKYVAERGGSADYIIAALHHDAVEDCKLPIAAFKKYDDGGEPGVSVSRIISFLSKPVIRMNADLDDPHVQEAGVHVDGEIRMVRIVHPESRQYTTLIESPEDKKLRKIASVRSFLNRMQINRVWDPEAGINVGARFWEKGRFSDEWGALNIKLSDVLANLQTYKGKIAREEREKKRPLSILERRKLLGRMVRERKEFIDLMPVVCPAMFDSLPEEIRDAYHSLDASFEELHDDPDEPAYSRLNPDYVPAIPVGPARGAIRPTEVKLIPKASRLFPNAHYVYDPDEPDRISKTKMELLLPKIMAFGRKPTQSLEVLQNTMDHELALNLSGADPMNLDLPLVRHVPSLLFPNDPHQFVGFELNLERFPLEKRHEIFDRIVQTVTPAVVAQPLNRLATYHPDLPGALFHNHHGLRWQEAPQFGLGHVVLNLSRDLYGVGPSASETPEQREHTMGVEYGLLADQLRGFITSGHFTEVTPLPLFHPTPTYYRYLVSLSSGHGLGMPLVDDLHRELKRVRARVERQEKLFRGRSKKEKPT